MKGLQNENQRFSEYDQVVADRLTELCEMGKEAAAGAINLEMQKDLSLDLTVLHPAKSPVNTIAMSMSKSQRKETLRKSL